MNSNNSCSFLRTQVNHYSFVTGLNGALSGKSGGPEDSSNFLNVILTADIIEGKKVITPDHFEDAPYHNILKGALCECTDLLTFIAGTYDSQKLKSDNNGFVKPTQFTLEVWETETEDQSIWQHKRNVIWEGIKWLDAAHTGDGGDRMCAGIATFTCVSKTVEDVENGETIDILERHKSRRSLRRLLQAKMTGPKHSAGYMG